MYTYTYMYTYMYNDMPNITVYINKDNYDRLQLEENKGGLINELLSERFGSAQSAPRTPLISLADLVEQQDDELDTTLEMYRTEYGEAGYVFKKQDGAIVFRKPPEEEWHNASNLE